MLLISHCNTEQVAWFGLSLHDADANSWFVDLSDCGLDPTIDKGITGLFQDGDRIYAAIQSTNGGKVLVLDAALNPLETIYLQLAEDLHSIAVADGVLYVTSTRNNSLVIFDLGRREESIYWQHEGYIHLNDIKFHRGEVYVLSQDSPHTETNTGGTVTRLSDRKTIVTGLDQPHSLWFNDNILTVLSSRVGNIMQVNLDSLECRRLAHLPGYVRGIWQSGDRFYAATSAERLHSRKSGPDKVYVENFDNYMGNPEFQSHLYQLDRDGNVLDSLPLSALNFEVYDLLGLKAMPNPDRLRPGAASLKAQYYRRQSTLGSAADTALEPRLLINYAEPLAKPASCTEALQVKGQMRRYRDEKDSFVRGCWYWSDGWPLNFWNNFDAKKARQELRRIKAMGFNTIFIVIPWRGFQPSHESPRICKQHLRRANQLMKLCTSEKLGVYARVSYGHAICNQSEGESDVRVRALLTDPAVMENWQAYLSAISTLSRHQSLAGFFLCWEDFWHPITDFQGFTPAERRDLAQRAGYHQWLADNVDLEHYNQAGFSNETCFEQLHEVEIPGPGSGRQGYFLDYRTAMLRKLFHKALGYISPLSMEYRVDQDRYRDAAGKIHFYSNDDYADVQRPALSYWAPFMNAHNQGEALPAERAVYNLLHMLRCDPQRQPACAPIINQLNFIDATPEYLGKHATIAPEAIPEFLNATTEVLIDHTSGYALWALRSYFQNLLYNPGFVLKEDGWETSGKVRFVRTGATPALQLGNNASVKQRFVAWQRGMDWITRATELTLTIDFCAAPQGPIDVTLEGHDEQTLCIEGASITTRLALRPGTSDKEELVLRVANRGKPLQVQRIALYGYVFDGQIQDPWGADCVYAEDIRQLNARLRKRRRAIFGGRILGTEAVEPGGTRILTTTVNFTERSQ